MKVKLLSRVRLLATPWTAAHQAPPSVGFSRQEDWSGVPLPLPVLVPTAQQSESAMHGTHILSFLDFLFIQVTAEHQVGFPLLCGWFSLLTYFICCCCYLVAKSCPTFCDPTDCSPPGSSVHGILQARILEWVAISFSKGSS